MSGSLFQLQYLLRFHHFLGYLFWNEGYRIRGTAFQTSSDMMFHNFDIAPGTDFTAIIDLIILLSLHSSIFFTIELPIMSALFPLFVPPSFSDVWFLSLFLSDDLSSVSARLLLWNDVLLRWLPSQRIVFSCSPDLIFSSFVWIDFVVFIFSSG